MRTAVSSRWRVLASRSRAEMSTWRARAEAIEGGEGRHGLAVLDLGDVGARYSHASCELTLREIAHVAQVSHGVSYLQAAFLG
ncbi:hypothetical protein RBB78_21155 [Tunturiibacter empetritectus]|uniref:hypothetical protein n=1 Tax=Tunturiibacter empetritectus TaxID=3069691 RepID=UPI003D9AE014